jgi:hypothetical protein
MQIDGLTQLWSLAVEEQKRHRSFGHDRSARTGA